MFKIMILNFIERYESREALKTVFAVLYVADVIAMESEKNI